nr:fatty-acid-binding protein 1 [Ipomoea batatas]
MCDFSSDRRLPISIFYQRVILDNETPIAKGTGESSLSLSIWLTKDYSIHIPTLLKDFTVGRIEEKGLEVLISAAVLFSTADASESRAVDFELWKDGGLRHEQPTAPPLLHVLAQQANFSVPNQEVDEPFSLSLALSFDAVSETVINVCNAFHFGTPNWSGIQFTSQFRDEIKIPRGAVIELSREPGYILQTTIAIIGRKSSKTSPVHPTRPSSPVHRPLMRSQVPKPTTNLVSQHDVMSDQASTESVNALKVAVEAMQAEQGEIRQLLRQLLAGKIPVGDDSGSHDGSRPQPEATSAAASPTISASTLKFARL